jgi:4,5-dihydroxyphthalate decarboxylase
VPVEPGKKIADLLIAGELAAAIGVEVDHPDVKPLIPNPTQAGYEALRTRGHYPANHLIVVRDELIEADPGLAVDVFEAFAESKRLYVERLKGGGIEQPTAVDRMHSRVMEITGRDPLPYGIEPNRAMLEEWVDHCLTQRIITRKVAVDDLFAPATRNLVA